MPKVSKYGAISGPYFPVLLNNAEKCGPLFTQYFFFFIFISFLARCIKFNEVLRRHCLIISSTVPLICFHLTSVGNGGCNYYVTINFCDGFSLKVKRNLLNKTCHKNRSDIQFVLIFYVSWKHQYNCQRAEIFPQIIELYQ